MPIFPTRATTWLVVLFVAILALAGLTGEASAQVFRGTLDFVSLPPLTMTVTLAPSGPASYQVALISGRVIDRGFLVGSVNGSSVTGFFQTTTFPNIRPCEFRGTINGNVVNLTLDEPSCGGGGGTLDLTRIS
jgi:hypothetical protein